MPSIVKVTNNYKEEDQFNKVDVILVQGTPVDVIKPVPYSGYRDFRITPIEGRITMIFKLLNGDGKVKEIDSMDPIMCESSDIFQIVRYRKYWELRLGNPFVVAKRKRDGTTNVDIGTPQ